MNYGEIAELNLWLNNVPEGSSAECVVGSVSAVPLRGVGLVSPKLSVNGTLLEVPLTINSGEYVEVEPAGMATHYNAVGDNLQTIELPAPPMLLPGPNSLSLDRANQPSRARVTLTLVGPPEAEP